MIRTGLPAGRLLLTEVARNGTRIGRIERIIADQRSRADSQELRARAQAGILQNFESGEIQFQPKEGTRKLDAPPFQPGEVQFST